MAILDDAPELMQRDLLYGNEALEIEFKGWMDISKNDKRAQRKIAQHVAALANYGGGRLYFGIDDNGNPQPPSADFPVSTYTTDAISNLLRERLSPAVQCDVRIVDYDGNDYPMIVVPSHDATPVHAKDDDGHFAIFIRDIGPQSIAISKYEHWESLLQRCVRNRENKAIREAEDDHVSRTQAMTEAITDAVIRSVSQMLAETLPCLQKGTPNGIHLFHQLPASTLVGEMSAATADDFRAQIQKLELSSDFDDLEARVVREKASNLMTGAYALLDSKGHPIGIEHLRPLLTDLSDRMRDIAYFGWSDFITLTNPDVAPRSQFWQIGSHKITGIEGMRNDSRSVFFGSLDYWRAYSSGIFTITKSYREDYQRIKTGYQEGRFISLVQFLMRMHSLVAHAALAAQSVAEVDQVLFQIEHRGLNGRSLTHGGEFGTRVPGSIICTTDIYPVNTIVKTKDLAEHYPEVLLQLCVPCLAPFEGPSGANQWITRECIETVFDMLNREGSAMAFPSGADAS